jgi:putative ATPase
MNPLADRLRPSKLSEIIGQKHIIGEDKLLYKAIKSGNIFSMILWGPPGVGKTTLARVIASEIEAEFMEFSAVTTGIAELKKIFEGLTGQMRLGQKLKTIIFIDEIHRFNKAQQDAFLPYVENGTVTLIGATTENPSFEIINPLLSRSRVFVLEPLKDEDLEQIIARGVKFLGVKIKKDAKEFLKEFSNGDGRVILNTLEIAAQSLEDPPHPSPLLKGEGNSLVPSPLREKVRMRGIISADSSTISKDLIVEALQTKALAYDKKGEGHYDTISAFIKSMRASNVDAALYYLARMVDAGEDPLFIARRMVIFASEDIGMAQPTALVVANEVFRACETIGLPECQINLAHGVTYLALAKKDRSSYDAYFKALDDVKKYGHLPIPLKIRNAPTKLMKELDYGKGYQMYEGGDLLPEKIRNKKYYNN